MRTRNFEQNLITYTLHTIGPSGDNQSLAAVIKIIIQKHFTLMFDPSPSASQLQSASILQYSYHLFITTSHTTQNGFGTACHLLLVTEPIEVACKKKNITAGYHYRGEKAGALAFGFAGRRRQPSASWSLFKVPDLLPCLEAAKVCSSLEIDILQPIKEFFGVLLHYQVGVGERSWSRQRQGLSLLCSAIAQVQRQVREEHLSWSCLPVVADRLPESGFQLLPSVESYINQSPEFVVAAVGILKENCGLELAMLLPRNREGTRHKQRTESLSFVMCNLSIWLDLDILLRDNFCF